MTITDEEKSLLPEFVKIWQGLTKEQHFLIFGYANGVASVESEKSKNER